MKMIVNAFYGIFSQDSPITEDNLNRVSRTSIEHSPLS